MITWYEDAPSLRAAAVRLKERMFTIEAYVEEQSSIAGYCVICQANVSFQTSAGVMMGDHTSLREGMQCQRCGVSSRGRLLFDAIVETFGRDADLEGAVLEAMSPLAASLVAQFPALVGSEYLGSDVKPGDSRKLRDREVRHESILGLSYADASLDVLVHNDVLEHVYDVDGALRESLRVLRAGGACVFVMPFFPLIDRTQVRGRLNDDGSIEHFEEPEYHGDGVTDKGIYTFYHYGIDFVDRLRAIGFDKVQIGLAHDVYLGYLSNNYHYGDDGIVLPTVFRASVGVR